MSLAVALVTVNAGCGGYRPTPEFDPGARREPVSLEGTPLLSVWQSRPVRGPSGPIATDSVAVYVGGSDQRVAAVDLASGRTRWTKRVSGPVVGGVLRRGRMLYVATERPGGRLHALETVSGNQRWSVGTGYVAAPITCIEGRLIVLTRERQVLAVDTATGHIAWRRRLPSQRVGPQPLGENRMLVTSFDSLYLLRVDDGRVLLRRRSPGTVVAPWLVADQELIAGTADSLILAIDPDSLRPRWQVRVDGPLLATPAMRADTVYGITQFGSLYRVVPGSPPVAQRLGTGRWPATGAIALFDGWALVGSSEGRLRALRLSDGAEAWTAPFGRPLELAPVLLGDSEFLALGGRGDLHRIRR